MEIDVTTEPAAIDATTVCVTSVVSPEAEGFGIRPRTDRPHSVNLFGLERGSHRDGVPRGLDLLLGIGIGAAVMYYFDPDAGARRRAAARELIVDAVTRAVRSAQSQELSEPPGRELGDPLERSRLLEEV